MPPMSSVRTFIAALKTGETRTTRALEKVVARRRGADAHALAAALRRRGALDAPLADPMRSAIRAVPLPERFVARCIDAWPDKQKEEARRAIVGAMRHGRRLQFRWGLTDADTYETAIVTRGSRVTITALSPRSSLRIRGDEIEVAPASLRRRRPYWTPRIDRG